MTEYVFGRGGRRHGMVFVGGRGIDQLHGLQTETRDGDNILLLAATAGVLWHVCSLGRWAGGL